MNAFSPSHLQVARRTAFIALLVLAGCGDPTPPDYQGYVEGEYVHVASPIGGRLDRLAVKRGDTIAAGAPLFALEAANESAAQRQAQEQLRAVEAQLADVRQGKRAPELDVTRARLAEARADAQKSATRLTRDEAQFRVGGIARQQVDDARAAHEANLAHVRSLESEVQVGELPSRSDQIRAQAAQVAASRAALEQAQWKLDQKTVKSTREGRVVDTLYREGEFVREGNPVVRMLPPANVKVRFFVPQAQVGALAVGREARVRCDGCAAAIPVTVSFIATDAEYTPPIIYSNETRAKLVFMVEARPSLADAPKLRPGQPVSVKLQ
ncbi:MAG: HlyD family efflux transporter periplasmic adaptor subunit [Betaproteobacteria bacterium]